jgi:hypothetical protein
MSDDESWSTNYDSLGRRSIYGEDGKIGEEYDWRRDTTLPENQKGSGGVRRRGGVGPGASILADIAVPIIGLALRYAPFVLLAYYLATRVVPNYYIYQRPKLVSWGIAVVTALVAVFIVRKLLAVVLSRPGGILMLPFRIILLVLITGIQFAVVVWFTFGLISPNETVPMSLEEVEIMTVVAAVIALPLGILVAWWIWHRWKESVI